MQKFVPVPPTINRINDHVISIRLPKELIEPFYKLCAETGLSPVASQEASASSSPWMF